MFAETEDDINKQVDEWGFSQYVNSMITEIHVNRSAYSELSEPIPLPPI